jgi:ATP-dependent Clp protease ATP-binding subunit ClpC
MATNDPFGDFRRRRGSLCDEFFSEFFDRPFGVEGAMSPTGARTSAPPARRPVEQVDITQYFSDATRELVQRAAQLALE